jgi:hypothetical protein
MQAGTPSGVTFEAWYNSEIRGLFNTALQLQVIKPCFKLLHTTGSSELRLMKQTPIV